MSLKNPVDRWGGVSQLLHWTIVALFLALATIGLTLDLLPRSPNYFWVYNLHKSLGLTMLTLALIRIGWRLYAGKPKPMASIPAWQLWLARVIHWLLYGLIVAMPFSGWLFDSAGGLRPLRWFGLFEVPKLVAPNPALREIARDAHGWLFWILVTLILMHAGAALYHHYFVGDNTLRRMLPVGRASSPSSGESR